MISLRLSLFLSLSLSLFLLEEHAFAERANTRLNTCSACQRPGQIETRVHLLLMYQRDLRSRAICRGVSHGLSTVIRRHLDSRDLILILRERDASASLIYIAIIRDIVKQVDESGKHEERE